MLAQEDAVTVVCSIKKDRGCDGHHVATFYVLFKACPSWRFSGYLVYEEPTSFRGSCCCPLCTEGVAPRPRPPPP